MTSFEKVFSIWYNFLRNQQRGGQKKIFSDKFSEWSVMELILYRYR